MEGGMMDKHAEETIVLRQEVAESHALLGRARTALLHSNRIMELTFSDPTPNAKAVMRRNTALINDIPHGIGK
jgi:hypothetical protein